MNDKACIFIEIEEWFVLSFLKLHIVWGEESIGSMTKHDECVLKEDFVMCSMSSVTVSMKLTSKEHLVAFQSI